MLVVIAFYGPCFWWAVFFALVPFIHALRTARSLKRALLLSVLFGSVLLGGATVATLWAEPPAYVGEFGATMHFLLVVASWLLFFVPLIPTVVAWTFVAYSVQKLRIFSALGLSVLWALLEWSRMYLFNIATYAPGVDNPPFFSAGALGYILADNSSWLQLASLVGVYGMSAVVMFVNILFYMLLRLQSMRSLAVLTAVLVTVSVFPVVLIRDALDGQTRTPLTVGIVSLYSSPSQLPLATTTTWSTQNELTQTIDLVVLPEGVATSTVSVVIPQRLVRDDTVVLSTRGQERGEVFANIALAQMIGSNSSVPVRAKSILAGQGEYITGVFLALAKGAGVYSEELAHHFTTGTWSNSFTAGPSSTPVSVMFCVEMLAPGFGKDLAKRDESYLLAIPMSHRQFRGAPTLRIDSLRFLKVRAVEANIPLVASGNATPGYAINRYGQVKKEVGRGGSSEATYAVMEVLSTAWK